MGIFQQFPYTNFHELNLDEILKLIKYLADNFEKYEKEFKEILEELAGIQLAEKIFIHNEEELAAVIQDPELGAYILLDFDVTEKIEIPDARSMIGVKFIGGNVTLKSTLFTNNSIGAGTSTSWSIPSFIGTNFIGEYNHPICDAGFYVLGGFFSSCIFNNVSLVYDSKCVQSTTFTNCRFIASLITPWFINTNALYEVKFEGCDLESDFLPLFINVQDNNTWGSMGTTCRQLSFVDCISEGRSASLVRFNDGDVELYGHYAEGNSAPLIDVYKASGQSYGFHNISIINSFLNTAATSDYIVVIEEDYNYENTSFYATGNVINNCKLVNTNKFLHYSVQNNQIVGTVSIPACDTMSKVVQTINLGSPRGTCWTNGIAFFSQNSRNIFIRPDEIVLLTFVASYSGASTTFIVVAGASASNGAAPFAYCLSHPSVVITCVYDSDLNMLTVSLPNTVGTLSTSRNMSATYLRFLNNNATGIDYYRGNLRNGFDPLDFEEVFDTI